jgi:hypothetical protein
MFFSRGKNIKSLTSKNSGTLIVKKMSVNLSCNNDLAGTCAGYSGLINAVLGVHYFVFDNRFKSLQQTDVIEPVPVAFRGRPFPV